MIGTVRNVGAASGRSGTWERPPAANTARRLMATTAGVIFDRGAAIIGFLKGTQLNYGPRRSGTWERPPAANSTDFAWAAEAVGLEMVEDAAGAQAEGGRRARGVL